MSSATIISIVPFPISEMKPGIYPGNFDIPASKNFEPEVLVIGDSKYHVSIDENRSITVKCVAADVAKSIVEDYIVSNLGFSLENGCWPGLTYELGTFTKSEVKSKFAQKLEALKKNQLNWFKKLVEMADDDWEKTHQHKCISDMQRHAARALNLDRPWIINVTADSLTKEVLTKCGACRSIISSEAIVCPNCKCILDAVKYKALTFAA